MRVEEVIAEITQRCKNYGAKRIILFGSRAKGTATERSDIDIAVAGVASCDIYELQEELEDIELEAKSEERKLIEKFVDENPEAVANLLRNWLTEDWG